MSKEESIDWILEFKPNALCSQINFMKALLDDANNKLKALKENDMKDTMEKYVKAIERYNQEEEGH